MKRRVLGVSRVLLGIAGVAFWVVAYAYVTTPDVRPLATKNPSTTAFMDLRAREAARADRQLRHRQAWIPYARISPNLKRAVLVAEDDGFFQHEGIDLEQVKQSIQLDLRKGKLVRGASTVTQQLAKNLYLSPSRNPLRKFREIIITRRLETELSKARIFELYLNVIEWGDGVWGAEAAARTYFGTSAASLTRAQAALLAGAIVNPRVLNPARPPRRLLRRQGIVLARMGGVEPPRAPDEAPAIEESPAAGDDAGDGAADGAAEGVGEGVGEGDAGTSGDTPVAPDESKRDDPDLPMSAAVQQRLSIGRH